MPNDPEHTISGPKHNDIIDRVRREAAEADQKAREADPFCARHTTAHMVDGMPFTIVTECTDHLQPGYDPDEPPSADELALLATCMDQPVRGESTDEHQPEYQVGTWRPDYSDVDRVITELEDDNQRGSTDPQIAQLETEKKPACLNDPAAAIDPACLHLHYLCDMDGDLEDFLDAVAHFCRGSSEWRSAIICELAEGSDPRHAAVLKVPYRPLAPKTLAALWAHARLIGITEADVAAYTVFAGAPTASNNPKHADYDAIIDEAPIADQIAVIKSACRHLHYLCDRGSGLRDYLSAMEHYLGSSFMWREAILARLAQGSDRTHGAREAYKPLAPNTRGTLWAHAQKIGISETNIARYVTGKGGAILSWSPHPPPTNKMA